LIAGKCSSSQADGLHLFVQGGVPCCSFDISLPQAGNFPAKICENAYFAGETVPELLLNCT
jgi:hypothetical protein